MGRYVVEDQPDLTIPEDTIVRGKLRETKEETISYNDKKTGEAKEFSKLVWWWDVQDDRYPGRHLKAECDAKLTNHPGNKFRQWAEALLGRELRVDEGIDDTELWGLQADLSVRHRPDTRPGVDKVYEEVDEVIPISGFGGDDDIPF